MSKLTDALRNKKGVIPYLTAGDGGIEKTEELIELYDKLGARAIEVGMPYSDPIADGPTIARSHARGRPTIGSLKAYLELIKRVRKKTRMPIICFTYYNPILQYGQRFYHDLKKAGGDAILIVDCPLDRLDDDYIACMKADIDPIGLITPNSTPQRAELICSLSRGMIYVVADVGITGVRDTQRKDLGEQLDAVSGITELPVACGFGIQNKQQVSAVLKHCQAAIIGSYFVDLLNGTSLSCESVKKVESLLKSTH